MLQIRQMSQLKIMKDSNINSDDTNSEFIIWQWRPRLDIYLEDAVARVVDKTDMNPNTKSEDN